MTRKIAVGALCEQYVQTLNDLLDKRAPLLTRTFTKESAEPKEHLAQLAE